MIGRSEGASSGACLQLYTVYLIVYLSYFFYLSNLAEATLTSENSKCGAEFTGPIAQRPLNSIPELALGTINKKPFRL